MMFISTPWPVYLVCMLSTETAIACMEIDPLRQPLIFPSLYLGGGRQRAGV